MKTLPFKDIEKGKAWHREYENNRYHSDPSFREKKRESAKQNQEGLRKHYWKLRIELFHLLGNKCSSCGFTDFRALDIDHVRNNGNEERKIYKNYRKFLRETIQKVKEDSKDYQLLCANCNRIKEFERKPNRLPHL